MKTDGYVSFEIYEWKTRNSNKQQTKLNNNSTTTTIPKKPLRIKTFWMYTTILSEIYSIYEPPRFLPFEMLLLSNNNFI